MREITLGQYYPSGSILHSLDPRVKFIGTMAFIAGLFIVKGPIGYIFCGAVLAALVILSKVPPRLVIKSLRPMLIILVITVVFNLLLTRGTVIFKLGFISITKAGVALAAGMGTRLCLLVSGSQIMTLTTTPNALTDAMERLFAFLRVIRVPVHEIAMMMSIALRFIPILMEETDKIKMAQTARGADFETGGFLKRMRAMIPLLVPLFVSAFRRANDLALAMEARCYHGGDGRTRMKPLKYSGADFAAYVVIAAFVGACVLLRIFKL